MESYQYVAENSKVHFEMRTHGSLHDQGKIEVISFLLALCIGVILALFGTVSIVVSGMIRLFREDAVKAAMAREDDAAILTLTDERVIRAYIIFIVISVSVLLAAGALTAWAPSAAGSGLPPLKAFLNGCHLPKLLEPATLFAKAMGTTLVVALSLPIGREGPMVHIGAALAACISSMRCPLEHLLFEMRSPTAQRAWVGVGAAAGVAAAFNAPLGGILYSFEEVCSHWSSHMTWLAFVCSVIVVTAGNFLNDISDGFLAGSSLVIGEEDGSNISLRASFVQGDFFWVAILGAVGGAVGAWYNLAGFRFARIRKSLFDKQRSKSSARSRRLMEIVILGTVLFSAIFWAPFLVGCRPCPQSAIAECGVSLMMDAEPSSASRSGGHGSSHGSHDIIHQRLHGLAHRRWQCAAGEYNELATLLHAGQEELVKHLLSRETDVDGPSLDVLGMFLFVYLAIATVALGLSVPAGNFIPALTIGAALGRMQAQILVERGYVSSENVGHYALVGAAATLGGVTRMTVTIAVILAEVTDDITTLPVCMLALAVARVVGNKISPSFDHGMIELTNLPFLRESPPTVFEVLTAKDVMAHRPVRLLEVTTVRDVITALTSTSHNGFPVVSGSCLSASMIMDTKGGTSANSYLSGVILRRQLLVLLREKVWNTQMHGLPLDASAKENFLTSFFVMAKTDLASETQRIQEALTSQELDAPLDLRSFFDPSPFSVNTLAPLTVVYRLFNEIGVRHIPVLTNDQNLVGIITRKDVQPENISHKLSAVEVHTWASDMHRYWQQLLFGSSSTVAKETEAAPGTGSRRLSWKSGGRMSSEPRGDSVKEGTRDGRKVWSNRTSTTKGQDSVLYTIPARLGRRTSADSRRGSLERRGSTERRGSITLLRSSAGINPLRRCSAPVDARVSAERNSDLSSQGSRKGSNSSQERQKSPSSMNPLNVLRASLNRSSRTSTPSAQRPGHWAEVLLTGHENRTSEDPSRDPSPQGGRTFDTRSPPSNAALSGQPSLQASLTAASCRLMRQSPNTTLTQASVAPSGRVSKHAWQFSRIKAIERRESAPAKLLSIQFHLLKAPLPKFDNISETPSTKEVDS